MPQRAVWNGIAPRSEVAPDWWYAILSHVKSDAVYSEYVASSSAVAELRREPVHRRALAHARSATPPTPIAPSSHTMLRLRTNTLLHGAARMRETVLTTSRPLGEGAPHSPAAGPLCHGPLYPCQGSEHGPKSA